MAREKDLRKILIALSLADEIGGTGQSSLSTAAQRSSSSSSVMRCHPIPKNTFTTLPVNVRSVLTAVRSSANTSR